MSAGETGTRVPLIASWKGRIKAGSVNDHLIDFTDILPTFVELGKGRMPEDRVIDGRSFLGHLLNRPNTPTREWVFAGYEKNAMIRSHKYLLDVEGRLFDVSKDRYHPLLLTKASYSKEAEAAHRTLEEVMKSLGHPYTGVKQSKKKAE